MDKTVELLKKLEKKLFIGVTILMRRYLGAHPKATHTPS